MNFGELMALARALLEDMNGPTRLALAAAGVGIAIRVVMRVQRAWALKRLENVLDIYADRLATRARASSGEAR